MPMTSTSPDEDNDTPNLWQARCHDLALQDIPPSVTDSDYFSNDDDSCFVSASQNFSEDGAFFHP